VAVSKHLSFEVLLLATNSYKQLTTMNYEFVARQLFAPAQINNLKYKMLLVFKSLLKYKLWKYELHNDLDGGCLALGEKVCLNLSFIIAARQLLNITEPFDYSVAMGLLDTGLRKGLSEYLESIFTSLFPLNH
jgi:hypothetical protein